MKTNYKLALAVLAGLPIGIAGTVAIQAQQAKTPPGFVIAEVEVTDPATMQKYGEKVPETLALSITTTLFEAARSRPSRAKRQSAAWS